MKKFALVFFLFLFVFLNKSSLSFAFEYLPTDTFTANNGTDINTYNSSYTTAEPNSPNGTATIENNTVKFQATNSNSDSAFIYTNLSLPTSYCTEADATTSNVNAGSNYGGTQYDWIRFDNGSYNFIWSLDPSNNRVHLTILTNNPFGGNGDWYYNLLPNANETHHLKACDFSGELTAYYDGHLLADLTGKQSATGDKMKISTNINYSAYVTVDNLHIYDNNLSPTPTPTATPTPTPTPTPTNIQLNVPLIKQTSNPWQSQLYDSANKWSPHNTSINTWGCAVTSAAMVLQYNGITKMPNNSDLNPGTLNAWLKSQPDGYVGNGWVNWLAIQRFSRIAKLAFNNPNYTADGLEYKRIGNADIATLTKDLQNNQPDILEEPNHFVVATGTNGTTFTINDPYFSRNTLNDGYNNTFSSLGRFIPSHTDLSYILLVGPESLDFAVKNASGSAVGEEFVQQPIEDPANPSLLNGLPVKMFYLSQPGNDTYTLTVTNANNDAYKAKAYEYDDSGNVQILDVNGSAAQSTPNTFLLTFSKTSKNQDKITKSSIFDIILTDANQFYQQNEIKKGSYNDLIEEINEAKKQYDKNHILQEKIGVAEILIKLIIWDNNHNISSNAYQALVADITTLLTH